MRGTAPSAHRAALAAFLVRRTAPSAHRAALAAFLVRGTALSAHQAALAACLVRGTAPSAHRAALAASLVRGAAPSAHRAALAASLVRGAAPSAHRAALAACLVRGTAPSAHRAALAACLVRGAAPSAHRGGLGCLPRAQNRPFCSPGGLPTRFPFPVSRFPIPVSSRFPTRFPACGLLGGLLFQEVEVAGCHGCHGGGLGAEAAWAQVHGDEPALHSQAGLIRREIALRADQNRDPGVLGSPLQNILDGASYGLTLKAVADHLDAGILAVGKDEVTDRDRLLHDRQFGLQALLHGRKYDLAGALRLEHLPLGTLSDDRRDHVHAKLGGFLGEPLEAVVVLRRTHCHIQ